MKTNAIIRICIYSLLILLLLGILASAIWGVSLYRHWDDRWTHHGAVETYAPRRIEEIQIYESPSEKGNIVGSMFANEEVDILQKVNANGKEWGRIEAPEAGWICLEQLEGARGESWNFPGVNSLSINWAAGKILIQAGDVDAIQVSEDMRSAGQPCVMELSHNGKLEIDFYPNDNWHFGIHHVHAKDLTVTVPRDLDLREIELDIASAEVEIRDLEGFIDEVDIDGASGTCTIENCNIRTLDVDTASGDVRFTGSLEALDFDAASAEFEGVFVNCPRSLKLDGMSGDMDITLPLDCGFTTSIDAMSSRFNAEQAVQTVNGAYVHGDGHCRIDVNGMSGDVNIHIGE